MKVLCLYQATVVAKRGVNDQAQVYVGSIYTVVDTIEYNGGEYYKLEEVEGALFFSGMFAPLTDEPAEVIEEPEMIEA